MIKYAAKHFTGYMNFTTAGYTLVKFQQLFSTTVKKKNLKQIPNGVGSFCLYSQFRRTFEEHSLSH